MSNSEIEGRLFVYSQGDNLIVRYRGIEDRSVFSGSLMSRSGRVLIDNALDRICRKLEEQDDPR